MRMDIDNAGFRMTLDIPEEEIERIHRPLLRRFDAGAERGRAIVFVAGPPGSGKSVLCAIWKSLADETGMSMSIAPLDGFHLSNERLREMGMLDRKGAPETFDADAFRERLAKVRGNEPVGWPIYYRNLHEPVEGRLMIRDERVIVVEGNYLLLDRPEWCAAAEYADFTVFIDANRDLLRERVIERHIRGGRSREEAEWKFDANDAVNIRLVFEESVKADITLHQDAEGRYLRIASA